MVSEGLATGRCICGAVEFTGRPVASRGIGACHCGQCRRWAGGGPFMAIRFENGVTVEKGEALRWFKSSDYGERGFCSTCGSSLFWRAAGEPTDWAINVSTLDDGHGQKIFEHIWVDFQPDWYGFTDDAPRKTEAQCLAEG